jgi:hypothetical protein
VLGGRVYGAGWWGGGGGAGDNDSMTPEAHRLGT